MHLYGYVCIWHMYAYGLCMHLNICVYVYVCMCMYMYMYVMCIVYNYTCEEGETASLILSSAALHRAILPVQTLDQEVHQRRAWCGFWFTIEYRLGLYSWLMCIHMCKLLATTVCICVYMYVIICYHMQIIVPVCIYIIIYIYTRRICDLFCMFLHP
jgi:hypothetical protein